MMPEPLRVEAAGDLALRQLLEVDHLLGRRSRCARRAPAASRGRASRRRTACAATRRAQSGRSALDCLGSSQDARGDGALRLEPRDQLAPGTPLPPRRTAVARQRTVLVTSCVAWTSSSPRSRSSCARRVRRFLAERAPIAYVRAMLDDERGTTDDVWTGLADARRDRPARARGARRRGHGHGRRRGRARGARPRGAPRSVTRRRAVGAVSLVALAGSDDDRAALLPGLAAGASIGTRGAARARPSGRVARPGDDRARRRRRLARRRDQGARARTHGAADVLVVTAATRRRNARRLRRRPAATPRWRSTPTPTVDGTRKEATVTLVGRPGPAPRHGRRDRRRRRDRRPARHRRGRRRRRRGARALELSVEYAKERQAVRRPDRVVPGGAAPVRRHAAGRRARPRRGVLRVLGCDAADPAERHRAATMAQAFAADELYEVGAAAIQVHGGVGFTWEHDIHLFYKRLLTLQHTRGRDRRSARGAGLARPRLRSASRVASTAGSHAGQRRASNVAIATAASTTIDGSAGTRNRGLPVDERGRDGDDHGRHDERPDREPSPAQRALPRRPRTARARTASPRPRSTPTSVDLRPGCSAHVPSGRNTDHSRPMRGEQRRPGSASCGRSCSRARGRGRSRSSTDWSPGGSSPQALEGGRARWRRRSRRRRSSSRAARCRRSWTGRSAPRSARGCSRPTARAATAAPRDRGAQTAASGTSRRTARTRPRPQGPRARDAAGSARRARASRARTAHRARARGQRLGLRSSRYATRSNAGRRQRGERLRHDQPVVHPEVRVHRRDPGGEPARRDHRPPRAPAARSATTTPRPAASPS